MTPRVLGIVEYVAARNGVIERSETSANSPLPLGVVSDSGNVGRAIIGYGYDVIANRNSLVTVLSPLLAPGSAITARNLAVLDAFRLRTELTIPGDPLRKV